MEIKKKTYQVLSIVFLIIALAALTFTFISHKQAQKHNLQQSEVITQLKDKNKKLLNQYNRLKSNRLKKYSANNLNNSSMDVKPNVDNFFKVINNWTGDNYATRSRRAKKYATENVVKLFVGGTDNETAAKQQAKQLKANDTKKKITDAHWYIEKTSGEKVNGLYIIATKSSVQDTNQAKQRQVFLITYNILQQKITNAKPVDLSNGSLDHLGE